MSLTSISQILKIIFEKSTHSNTCLLKKITILFTAAPKVFLIPICLIEFTIVNEVSANKPNNEIIMVRMDA